MAISAIGVHGLFDRFNHDIPFNPDERIAIIIGPNGFGKTMMLRIVDSLFNRPLQTLESMPFQKLEIHFDNSSSLVVTNDRQKTSQGQRKSSLNLKYMRGTGQPRTYRPERSIRDDDPPFPVRVIEEFVPNLDRIGASEWRDSSTEEIMDLDDVFAQYGHHFPPKLQFAASGSQGPAWLNKLRDSITVHFIDTERLTDLSSSGRRSAGFHRPYRGRVPKRTVRRYSEQLAKKLQSQLADYATLSQSLDRSFPARLVEEPTGPIPSIHELQQKLSEVEERRSNIIESGLLVQDDESLSMPVIREVDDSRRGVLAVYTQDALQKLSVFDELYARVNAFKRIANQRLLYKDVSVSTDGIRVSTVDGAELNLEMLSSGEQHQLVLLYELLFEVTENSLIMIDEPELSLHVDWQRQMLKDLDEIASLSNYRVLLATHSPQIIGDHWNLAIQLKGPDSQ